jgi:hypothetical protein
MRADTVGMHEYIGIITEYKICNKKYSWIKESIMKRALS